MAATTRSVASSKKPHLPIRPSSLPVSPHQIAAPHGAVGGVAAGQLLGDGQEDDDHDMFVSGEEERTPEGGVREFVGHPYKSLLINNGETVVSPDKAYTPPNMVVGLHFPLDCYRRQFSDNNHNPRALLRHYGAYHHRADVLLQRQNSEPLRERDSYYIDNNGRRVSYARLRDWSPTRSL